MRTSPSIVYMPRINQWWDVLSESMKTTLLTTIQNLDPASPILLLATSEEPLTQIDAMVSAFLLLLHVFQKHFIDCLEITLNSQNYSTFICWFNYIFVY